MSIRWSKKARRFYDDQTGYPVSKTRGFKSSIGRKDYARSIRQRSIVHKRRIPSKARTPHARKFRQDVERVSGGSAIDGYVVRPLAEEFAEELEDFDGTLDEEMDFDDYMDYLDETDGTAMDDEDSYSED